MYVKYKVQIKATHYPITMKRNCKCLQQLDMYLTHTQTKTLLLLQPLELQRYTNK